MRRATRLTGVMASALAGVALAAGAGLPAFDGIGGAGKSATESGRTRDPGRFAYHLRVVRIAGVSSLRGAGYGCKNPCGTPIVLPEEEAWGTPRQLEALARVLGGDRADAVTGFIVNPGRGGESRFEGTIYPGPTWVGLEFEASVPADGGGLHDLRLRIEGPGGSSEPLTEAHLLVGSERTVAIAAPSPIDGEWIVVAVTPMDPEAVEERIKRVEKIEVLTMDDRLEPPNRIRLVQPVFPEAARQEKRSGRIVLQAVIDTEGVPRAVRVLRVPPGCEDLASASVEAVQQWRYEPARIDGRPVPIYFTIQVEFTLS
jgi:TonB family protein